jgi:hypothetical protein
VREQHHKKAGKQQAEENREWDDGHGLENRSSGGGLLKEARECT